MSRSSSSSPVVFYDTTLRDGMQGIEINFTLDDKLAIARMLDELRIDYIEGGFPLANELEAEFFRRIQREKLQHSRIVAFGSTRRPGHRAASDPHITALIEAETPTVIVVGKSWSEHVTSVLGTSLEENLEMIHDSIYTLKQAGREVFFDLEHFFDGYKHDPGYALKALEAGTQAGADCLVLCDTNGGTLPHEVRRIIGELPQDTLAPLGGHFHNDCGTAVANSLDAILAGARHVQGTINGWGERCGNANLCGLIPNVQLKLGLPNSVGDRVSELTTVSRFIAAQANIIPDKRQPFVGSAAFSHKAGQHADVVQKAPHLMEHMDAGEVGNERQILLSALAGKGTILAKLQEYGNFSKNSPEVACLLDLLKKKEAAGYEYEAAEASFDLIIRQAIGSYTPLFGLKNYHLESFKAGDTASKTVGRIFLNLEEHDIMGAAVGIGPVETLDHALRDALTPHFPELAAVELVDYRVRVLNPESHAAAKVRVFITSTNGEDNWNTVGVHENIVEASYQALVDSLEYYYNACVLGRGRATTSPFCR
ncbi:citramalate synthase [Spirochaeta africana]|uniref:Citramalate synthase n=1 Tax=Spirochaeta africana (strain ATCC 700263 / DSM 8902 / Z-7692) TaxID=889378 RepID=H9UKA5_SPIAZ|nr:citramalate synthase [Spirochaeta africana]AFG37948.1 2-isopropylmalate synthase/homocitrate synthase family protein [Spirochaeta africana DSM 8902]